MKTCIVIVLPFNHLRLTGVYLQACKNLYAYSLEYVKCPKLTDRWYVKR